MTASETLFETIYITRKLPAARVSPIKRIANMMTGAMTVLAVVLATAIPAQADRRGDDLAKALAAAIALGLIVNGIDKHNRPRDPAPQPEPDYYPRPHHPRPHYPDPQPAPSHKPRIPSVCAIQFDGAERSVIVFPESCLREEGFRGRLPRHCARTARIYGQTDTIYGERCLRDAGYRIGRNRY